MSSEQHEMEHSAHEHPGVSFYVKIGAVLIFLTILEVVAYLMEVEWHMLGPGAAAITIGLLSALKFVTVVMYYMHLKFDHKLFTGIFAFPALLGTLVITAMYLLQQGFIPQQLPG